VKERRRRKPGKVRGSTENGDGTSASVEKKSVYAFGFVGLAPSF